MKGKFKERIRESFPFLFVKPIKLPDAALPGFSDSVLAEEETIPGYDAKEYFNATPERTIGPASRYRLLLKFAYTAHSVTWIAQDLQRFRKQGDRLVAVKIFNNTNTDDERDLEEYISSKYTSKNTEYGAIWPCTEKFVVEGPHGKHSCLIYKPVREPMDIFLERLPNNKPSVELAKAQLIFLLDDLTPSNIYMSFESEGFLLDNVKQDPGNLSMKRKYNRLTDRFVYGCHRFGSFPLENAERMRPKISGFGLAHRLGDGNNQGQPNTRIIQRPPFRAPEVILGCGWDCKADIWNFAILAWYLVQGTGLFSQGFDDPSPYQVKAHIADMISLLGPPPSKVLIHSETLAHTRWPKPYTDEMGRECWSPWEYFDGPLFDEQGGYLHGSLIAARSLEDEVTALNGQEKHDFVAFMGRMLEWNPENRASAQELITHPFLWRGSHSGVPLAKKFFGLLLPEELETVARTYTRERAPRED
ncbi:hypothetical protein FQN53_007676 [Emmonsiellopsis sp. PD_33]|nr:hypothetical protein FQN53_007676 [Emmonsiellopsis sp. PD_33]